MWSWLVFYLKIVRFIFLKKCIIGWWQSQKAKSYRPHPTRTSLVSQTVAGWRSNEGKGHPGNFGSRRNAPSGFPSTGVLATGSQRRP
jgi:hypothetical protein